MEETQIKDKKEYELAFLIKEEGELPAVLDSIKRHGAEISLEGPLKNLSLAYKIKKQTSAIFGYCHFQLEPENLSALDHDLRMNSPIIRFLVITPPFSKAKSSPSRISARSRISPSKSEDVPAKSTLPLSNEALEKKIEEILQ